MRPARRTAPGTAPIRRADPLAGAIDYALLVSVGWDPATKTLAPDARHPLLGYPVCTAVGCAAETWHRSGLCAGCRPRLEPAADANTLTDSEAFAGNGVPRKNRSRDRRCLVCCVLGFERPVGTNDLCSSCDAQRRRRHQSIAAYVDGDDDYPAAKPRPCLGYCTVAACGRLAAHRGSGLCGAHDGAWRLAGSGDLAAFGAAASPCLGDRSGRVVLAGLDDDVIAEFLYGVQASLVEGRRLIIANMRGVADHLRRCGARCVADAVATAAARTPIRWFLAFTADRVALVRSDPATEQQKDVWDLRLWGAAGRLSFVGGATRPRYRNAEPTRPITQPWLAGAAKTWAAEALTTMTAAPVRAVIGAVGLLAEHLGRRPDAGVDPAALSHRDIQDFIGRLNRLKRAAKLSAYRRDATVNLVAKFLRDCREMGLTQPGAVLGALPEDVVIRRTERTRTLRRDDAVGHALPDVVMAQLLDPANLERLEDLAGATIRAAVELGAGVGRRTAELCTLRFACLDYDEHTGGDGDRPRPGPVLVHDMPKVDKVGCRLPIHDREAAIITAQQQRVRAAFPDTPTDQLVLFPRPLTNPDGTKPIGTSNMQRAMRAWVIAMVRLDGPERDATGRPIPFPREQVIPYAFRHSFAQRHADAGTPVDTLKELLGHDTVRTTLGYYRVTTRRKRAAQDALGPLQLDADATLVRPGRVGLLSTQALREQIGQVAVPFGICTEPANVSADGHSCPFRHRCFGCEYFRTDPSYQPELSGYLAQLLADHERLAAAVPQLTPWARSDAIPSTEEIKAVRRLVAANEEILAGLDADDRERVTAAITTVRTSRAALDTSFPVEFRGLTRQAAPTLFPTIEATAKRDTGHGRAG